MFLTARVYFSWVLVLANFVRCILDGEMLVWDTSSKRFAEFGSNQEIGMYFNMVWSPQTFFSKEIEKWERISDFMLLVKQTLGMMENQIWDPSQQKKKKLFLDGKKTKRRRIEFVGTPKL